MVENKIWYRYFKDSFAGSEPGYFEVANEPWVKYLEEKFPLVKEEVSAFINSDKDLLKDYRFHISHGRSQWQTYSLQSWGFKHLDHIKKLPTTWQIFNKIEGLVSVSISRLVANNIIPGHNGDTNAIYRCHYGIRVPGTKPDCCFVVEDVERDWQEGKTLAFCDARFHYARNLTNEDRYVIIFDVIRPEFHEKRNEVCSKIIVTHLIYALDLQLGFYNKAPRWLLEFLLSALSPFARLYIYLQDLFF